MNRTRWKTRIKKACILMGTYNENMDLSIDALAKVLEIRDAALTQFDDDGKKPVIEKTNNKGFSNLEKHPSISIINEYSMTALSYFRELGLTPKCVKTFGADAAEANKGTFEQFLEQLGI